MALPLAVGAIPAGIGLADSILGKKAKANVDIAGMTNLVNTSANSQKNIVGNQSAALGALNPGFQASSDKLGTDYTKTSDDLAKSYQANLNGLGTADTMAADKAKALNQEQTARNIPLQQALIRQNLAATGGNRTGVAASAINAPVVTAAQQNSDFGKSLDIQNLKTQSARQEQGINTLYQSQAGAALQKLGLDSDTMKTLLANNRSDIILQAGQLLGIDQQTLSNMLGIKGLEANVSIANAAGANANKAALDSSLVGLSGTLMGRTMQTSPAVK